MKFQRNALGRLGEFNPLTERPKMPQLEINIPIYLAIDESGDWTTGKTAADAVKEHGMAYGSTGERVHVVCLDATITIPPIAVHTVKIGGAGR